jgi:sigma-B regulation protein RsbU (phosphoserine phosphatase)
MSDTQYMQCMEVWGGNQAVDSGVIMAGLDAWAFSKPWQDDAAGGDVHYVSSCASGHGSKVAETATRLRQLMRRFVNHLDQRRFIAALNNEFGQLSQDGRFATAVALTFFGPTKMLMISNAGHPPPMLYRAKTRRWQIVTPETMECDKSTRPHVHKSTATDEDVNDTEGPANLPLGILDAPRYDALSLRLAVGDLVLCYTDSLIESHSRDGRMLGAAGLLEVLQRIEMGDPSQFIPTLLQAIADEAPGNLTHDDVTVLLFRPNGVGLPFSLRERLSTYGRMLGAAGRAIIGRERFPWPDFHMANVGGAILGKLSQRWQGE